MLLLKHIYSVDEKLVTQTKPNPCTSAHLQKTGGTELRDDWLTSERALTEPLSMLFPNKRKEEIEKRILGKKSRGDERSTTKS